MSFAGQVLCQRMLIGPWALTTVGAVTVAAVTTAAPRRKLRRVVWLGREDCDMASPWLLMDAIRPRERRFWIGWPFLELRAGSWVRLAGRCWKGSLLRWAISTRRCASAQAAS